MAKTKLTPADEKFVRDFLNVTDEDFDATQTFTRSNRFSGEEFEVGPIEAKAIDFVYGVEEVFGNEVALKRISKNLTVGNAIQKFDRARMLVMKLDAVAYMGILD